MRHSSHKLKHMCFLSLIFMKNSNFYEELEKELQITQEAVLKLGDFCGRMRSLLVAHGTLTELDNKYILGELSVDDYVKQYKEQNPFSALQEILFPYAPKKNSNTSETDSKEPTQDGKSD